MVSIYGKKYVLWDSPSMYCALDLQIQAVLLALAALAGMHGGSLMLP